MPNCGEWIQSATERLLQVRFPDVVSAGESARRSDGLIGIDSPHLSARLLVQDVLKISREELATHPERPLSRQECARLEGLLRRREQGEPIAYLLGEREFFGRSFKVTPATLIPRPESELLIETALHLVQKKALVFADLGTGSGCLAVTLCAEHPEWQGIALDCSKKALSIAQSNAQKYKVDDRLLFVQGNFLQPCVRPSSLDLVVSNPPYLSEAEYAGLSPEVRDFEPLSALLPLPEHDPHHDHHDSHKDDPDQSLHYLKAVATAAWSWLRPEASLLMEHGFEQGEALVLWLKKHNWDNIVDFQDLSGKNRLILAQRPSA